MLRLLCSLRAPYDTLDELHEEPRAPEMDSNPRPNGDGADGADLKLSRVVRSPDPNTPGANTKESALQSWKAALGIKAKSSTKHLDRSVRSQQASVSPQEAERYIRLPERPGRQRDAAFEQTHIYLTAGPRTGPQPHKDLLRLPGPRAARAHLEKSNSENALQRLDVRCGGAKSREPSGPLQRLLRLEQRSPRTAKPRASSLERNHKFRVVPAASPSRARTPESVRSQLAAESPPPPPPTTTTTITTTTTPTTTTTTPTPTTTPPPPPPPLPATTTTTTTTPPPPPPLTTTTTTPPSPPPTTTPTPPPPPPVPASVRGQLPRLRQTPTKHELSAGLVNLVMSKDKGSGVQGNFINKPARGWLHADGQVADEGICYAVRYIGCLEVKESMKALNFDTRSLIAKECIARVCEAAGLKSAERKPRLDKRMSRSLGERPIMDQAGSNVTLTITSSRLTLTTLEEGQVIATHEMPYISFASGGDADTMDFVAYVAKDSRYGRVCFVLECGGVAQNVITTIGQAFELRFKEYLKRTPPYAKSCIELSVPAPAASEDPEYYNDLPGKVPPDFPAEAAAAVAAATAAAAPAPVQAPAAAAAAAAEAAPRRPVGAAGGLPPLPNLPSLPADRESNLIDLSSPPAASKTTQHEYVNGAVIAETRQAAAAAAAGGSRTAADPRDPFDMQPFGACLPAGGSTGGTAAPATVTPRSQSDHKRKLAGEIWYHGPISRRSAESLLVRDGDFLVRESHGAPGQFVLTGLQNGVKKHLLLVDPEGVVRTKDRTFDSVAHLIQYHRDYQVPILSAETALTLRNPVPRR